MRAELAQMQAHEQRVNDQIMQIESERKVGQLHNLSLVSHLSVDPVALANMSMLQGHYNASNNMMGGTVTNNATQNLDISSFGGAAENAQINEDRLQIV